MRARITVFAFPEGGISFEPIHHGTGGIKGLVAMRRACDHHHNHISHRNGADAMMNMNGSQLPLFLGIAGDCLQFVLRHGGIVLQRDGVNGLSRLSLLARHANERGNRAIVRRGRLGGFVNERGGINGLCLNDHSDGHINHR